MSAGREYSLLLEWWSSVHGTVYLILNTAKAKEEIIIECIDFVIAPQAIQLKKLFV